MRMMKTPIKKLIHYIKETYNIEIDNDFVRSILAEEENTFIYFHVKGQSFSAGQNLFNIKEAEKAFDEFFKDNQRI